MGLQARLMSQALRKLTGVVSKSKTCLIFINQIREKSCDVRQPGNHHRRRALKFYASIRIDIRRIAAIKDGEAVIGNRTKVKVVKNKLAAPFRRPSSTSSTAKASRAKATSWIWAWRRTWSRKAGHGSATRAKRIGQGRENAKQFLRTTSIFASSSRSISKAPWPDQARTGERRREPACQTRAPTSRADCACQRGDTRADSAAGRK